MDYPDYPSIVTTIHNLKNVKGILTKEIFEKRFPLIDFKHINPQFDIELLKVHNKVSSVMLFLLDIESKNPKDISYLDFQIEMTKFFKQFKELDSHIDHLKLILTKSVDKNIRKHKDIVSMNLNISEYYAKYDIKLVVTKEIEAVFEYLKNIVLNLGDVFENYRSNPSFKKGFNRANLDSSEQNKRFKKIKSINYDYDSQVNDSFNIYLDPGKASANEVAEFFIALNELYRAIGGSGLKFTNEGQVTLVRETV